MAEENNSFEAFGPSLTALLQLFLPFISQTTNSLFVGGGGNPYSNMQALQRQQQFMALLQSTGRYDARTVNKEFQGLANLFGLPWSRDAEQTVSKVIQYMPLAEMLIPGATNIMDRMLGQRGSAFIMAQQMFPALTRMQDPLTGMRGVSPEGMRAMMGQLIAPYFVGDQFRTQYAGLRMGEIGGLFAALQSQGMLPTATADWGQLNYNRQTTEALTRAINEAEQRGAPVGHLRRWGRRISPADLAALPMDVQAELRAVPEVAAQLYQIDAARIKNTLTAYSRTVKAVKEIFGEEGRGDAPMPELLKTLSVLTSTQLRGDPVRMEQELRTTLNLARASGVTTAELGVRMAQLSQTAAVMGLPPNAAVQALRVGLEVERGYFTGGYAALPGYASPAQIREQAERRFLLGMRSGGAKTIGAVQFVAEALNPEEPEQAFRRGSEAEALWRAIQTGEREYEFEGKTKTIFQSPEAVLRILEQGQNRFTAAELRQFAMNEAVAERFAESPLARRVLPLAQTEEMEAYLARAAVSALGANREMRPFVRDRDFMMTLSREVVDEAALRGVSGPEDLAGVLQVVAARRAEQGDRQAARLATTLRRPDAARGIAATMWAAVGSAAMQARPGERLPDVLGQIAAIRRAEPFRLEEEAEAHMQALFADIPETSLLRRITEAVIKATPETRFLDILSAAGGGVNVQEIKQRLGEDGESAFELFRESSQEYRAVVEALKHRPSSRQQRQALQQRKAELERATRHHLQRIRTLTEGMGLEAPISPLAQAPVLEKRFEDVAGLLAAAGRGALTDEQKTTFSEQGTQLLAQLDTLSVDVQQDAMLNRRIGPQAKQLQTAKEAFEKALKDAGTDVAAFFGGNASQNVYQNNAVQAAFGNLRKAFATIVEKNRDPFAGVEGLSSLTSDQRTRLAALAANVTRTPAEQGAVFALLEMPQLPLAAVRDLSPENRALIEQARNAYASQKTTTPAASAARTTSASTGSTSPTATAGAAAATSTTATGAPSAGTAGTTQQAPVVGQIHIGTLYVRSDGSATIVPTP